MNETIQCLTSVADLRELAREFAPTDQGPLHWSIKQFLDWLAQQTNEPRFVALACPAEVPVASAWQGAYPVDALPAVAWGSVSKVE